MKVLLVDDEELQLIRLTEAVRKAMPEETELFCYTNPVLAWEGNKETPVDIAFLDIEMPVLGGIQLAKRLKSVNPQVNVIFVTAYSEYALDAYQIHASGYVTKPVNVAKIKQETEGLRYPVQLSSSKKLQIKCFGNFEVFADGVPVKFRYSKSKELFAYLVDREGAVATINELSAVLWEEDRKSYLRNLIADIQATLASVGASDVFVKRFNECFINVEKVDCDAYEYKRNDPDAVRAYRGEYMMQYSWPIFQAE